MFFKQVDKTQLYYILKGILVGLLTGGVVSLFRLTIERLGELTQKMYLLSQKQSWYLLLLLVTSIGAAFFVGFLIKSDSNIKGSGIPQVEGQLQGELTVSWFSVLWKKFIGGVLSVGSGLFLGREGPSIQLGAVVGEGTSYFLHSPSAEKKILISSGASAGLAAAFNAPIAGLLFVLEEIHHSFSPLVWLTSFTSAITANFVSLYFFGLKPVLSLGEIPSLPFNYYGYLVLLGVVLGILGFIYQRVLLNLPKIYCQLPFPTHFYGFVPFLLVLPIGYFWPTTLGGGNQLIIASGHAIYPLTFIFGLFVLRFFFSMISYGANLPGGIFLPILTLGALIGCFYGTMLVQLTGMNSMYVKDFIVIAMAGYFTAIGKAPLTAIILVTEMVGSLNHLMPLGVVSLFAYIVNDLLGGNPIYESLLERLLQQQKQPILVGKTTFEFPITAESSLDGRMVRDFNWPNHMLLVSIIRGNKEILTHGDTIMTIGDILVILTDEQHLLSVRKAILDRSSTMINKHF